MKGFQLGTYILEDKLGEGGMAEVWRARNPVLNTYAAVKFLVPRLAGNPDIEKRFLGEGKRQAALQHPNIVSAFDFHYVDNRSFLVMRYIDGENLDHRLFKLQAPMSLPEAAAISRDVLSALDYAHSQGVVHRDIKPSNLLIENGGRVHVLDFGIALVLGEDRLTRVGAAIGTPHYMSPEQIVGARNIDGRTDIYSFGCVLYQILTQATPFDATEQEGNVDYIVKDRHLREEPVPPSQLNPAIPVYVEQVILRCLAKKPGDRYSTCAEVLAALSGERERPFPVRNPTVVESFPPPATPLPPRITPAPLRPSATPAAVETTQAPPAPQPAAVAPKAASKSPLWAGIGVAAVLLAGGGGYLALHHGSGTSDSKTPGTKPVDKPVDKPAQPVVVEPPPSSGKIVMPPSGGTPVSKKPAAPSPVAVDKKPEAKPDEPIVKPPSPPAPAASEPNVEQLLSQGKAELANDDGAAARESFRKAANAGNAQGMVLLGTMYSGGLGGPKSDALAFNLFQKAADLGYPGGMYNLGLMYEGGKEVPKDPDEMKKAASWYEKAVDRGARTDAAFRLGTLYEKGQGVPKDLAQARRYYTKAGTPQAKARLAALSAQ